VVDVFRFVSLIGVLVMIGSVATLAIPGTKSLDIPAVSDGKDRQQTYDLSASVDVEGLSNGAKFREPTFAADVEPHTLFSFAATGPSEVLSLTGANNVRVKWTLNGPIDSSISSTESFGELSGLDAETVKFSTDGIPPGEYVLHVNLYYSCKVDFGCSGSDYFKKTIQVGGGS
jgi:hypothetical protein